MRSMAIVFLTIISLVPAGRLYADSFVIESGFWQTRGEATSTNFVAGDLTGTAHGLGFIDPTPGAFFGLGETVSFRNLLVSDGGSFNLHGETFQVNAAAPSSYSLQVSGNALSLPSSLLSTLILETPALLSGSVTLCAVLTQPCVTHSVTGAGMAHLSFTGLTGPDGSPAYQFHTANVAFNPASSVMANPEPTTLLLLGSGLVGIGLWRRAQRKQRMLA